MEIRLYKNGDGNGINDLFNNYYKKERTYYQWNWEFAKNPYGCTQVVVDDKGHIIGTQALLPSFLNIDGIKVFSAKSEATLLNPLYRGKKLFEQMYNVILKEAKSSGINLIWGFTGATKPFQKAGFTVCEPMSELWLVCSFWKTFICIFKEKKLGNNLHGILRAIQLLGGLTYFRLTSLLRNVNFITRSCNLDIRPMDVFDDNTDKLFDKFVYDNPDLITIWRSKQYLNWRICQNPYYKHGIIGLYHDNDFVGYVVFAKDVSRGMMLLVDVLVLNRYAGIGFRILLKEIKRICKKDELGYIKFNFVFSGNDYCKKLATVIKKHGFCKLPFFSPTVIKVITDNYKDARDINKWYINSLFTEGTI